MKNNQLLKQEYVIIMYPNTYFRVLGSRPHEKTYNPEKKLPHFLM